MSKGFKTNKALQKRIKITGTGKVLKRHPGQNHFNAKDSGSTGLHKKGSMAAPAEYFKQFQALMPKEL